MPDNEPATAQLERLRAPASWWALGAVAVAAWWAVLAVALPSWVALLGAAAAAACVGGALVATGRVLVGVRDGEVVAGRAHVPVGMCGEVSALDVEQTRRLRGVDADANAFLLTRPYVATALRVDIRDPADPTPYWLVSARDPQRLVAAVRTARGAAGWDEAR